MDDINYDIYTIIIQYCELKNIVKLCSCCYYLRDITIKYLKDNKNVFNYKHVYDILTFNDRDRASFDLLHSKFRKYINYKSAIDGRVDVYWYEWMNDVIGGSRGTLYRVNSTVPLDYKIKPSDYEYSGGICPMIIYRKYLGDKTQTLISKTHRYKSYIDIYTTHYSKLNNKFNTDENRAQCTKCDLYKYDDMCYKCDIEIIEFNSYQLRRKDIIYNYIGDGKIIEKICDKCKLDIAFEYTSSGYIKCVDCSKSLYNITLPPSLILKSSKDSDNDIDEGTDNTDIDEGTDNDMDEGTDTGTDITDYESLKLFD